jgi:hypothetical protein
MASDGDLAASRCQAASTVAAPAYTRCQRWSGQKAGQQGRGVAPAGHVAGTIRSSSYCSGLQHATGGSKHHHWPGCSSSSTLQEPSSWPTWAASTSCTDVHHSAAIGVVHLPYTWVMDIEHAVGTHWLHECCGCWVVCQLHRRPFAHSNPAIHWHLRSTVSAIKHASSDISRWYCPCNAAPLHQRMLSAPGDQYTQPPNRSCTPRGRCQPPGQHSLSAPCPTYTP